MANAKMELNSHVGFAAEHIQEALLAKWRPWLNFTLAKFNLATFTTILNQCKLAKSALFRSNGSVSKRIACHGSI